MKVAPPSKARQVSAAAVVGAPRTDTMPIKFATAKVCRLVRTASLSLFGDDFAILPLLAHSFRCGADRKVGPGLFLICRSRFPVLEWRLFVGGHALFGHRKDHGDADIGPGHRRQIDDLLFAEKLLGAIEQLV